MDASNLVEIEAIKQLKARYFRYMDEKRWDDWGQVFTEEAILDASQDESRIVTGREKIVQAVSKNLGPAVTVHHGHMPEVELTGLNTARGVWPMEDILEFPTDPPFKVHGRGHYHEEYEKGADGQWRIAKLVLTRLWVRREGRATPGLQAADSDEG